MVEFVKLKTDEINAVALSGVVIMNATTIIVKIIVKKKTNQNLPMSALFDFASKVITKKKNIGTKLDKVIKYFVASSILSETIHPPF